MRTWLGGAVEIYSQGEATISLPCKIQGIMKACEAAFDPLRKFGSEFPMTGVDKRKQDRRSKIAFSKRVSDRAHHSHQTADVQQY